MERCRKDIFFTSFCKHVSFFVFFLSFCIFYSLKLLCDSYLDAVKELKARFIPSGQPNAVFNLFYDLNWKLLWMYFLVWQKRHIQKALKWQDNLVNCLMQYSFLKISSRKHQKNATSLYWTARVFIHVVLLYLSMTNMLSFFFLPIARERWILILTLMLPLLSAGRRAAVPRMTTNQITPKFYIFQIFQIFADLFFQISYQIFQIFQIFLGNPLPNKASRSWRHARPGNNINKMAPSNFETKPEFRLKCG